MESDETYRYDNLRIVRWLSRDPLGEEGGLNLYGFVGNDGVNDYDYLGQIDVSISYSPKQISGIPWQWADLGKPSTPMGGMTQGGTIASPRTVSFECQDGTITGPREEARVG